MSTFSRLGGLANASALLLLLCVMAARGHAQEAGPPTPTEDATVAPSATTPQDASVRGLAFGAAYTADGFRNVTGGVRRDGTLLHNVDLSLAMDGEAALGFAGLEAFLYVLGNFGGSVSEIAGDWQAASNIEAPAALRLYELWVQQRWRDRLSLRVGLYDLNSEFYVSDVASLFVNSAHGIGPEFAASGNAGPSIFPVTSLTARLRWTPGAAAYAMLAVLDGAPGHPEQEDRFVEVDISADEGALVAAEVGLANEAWMRKLALGGWRYAARFPDAVQPDVTHRGAYGGYLLAETRLYDERGSSDGGMSGFARLGYADDAVHAVQWSWGGGLVYVGPPGREEDHIGLGVAAASHAARYLRARERAGAPVHRGEAALELTYSLQAAPWVRIQPDIQYIVNPGMDPRLGNALLVGARVELTLQ